MTHLVLVLVLAAAVQSGACPTMCTCTPSPTNISQISATCDGSTTHLDEATNDLTLDNLDARRFHTIIEDLSEIKLPHLTHITITRSVVPDLTNVTFGPQLRSIKLAANKITVLSESLVNATGVQVLDLSNNTITSINSEPFRTLRNLQVLNLSANFLHVIDSNSFSGLASLKCLDISGNHLATLDERAFAPLQSLQYLNLSTNRLENLNHKCFMTLSKLQQLDVSWNRLTRVELGTLQLPSLARLLLAGNSQLGVSPEPVLLVGTGQRLQTVDASQIGLKQVPAALTHSIRTLRLADNSIKTVRCGDLDSYPLLQLLDFKSNGLELIEDDALGRLDSLSVLYLTNNNMKEIPKSLSEKLTVLHLERNNIEQVFSKDFQGLSVLEVLLLNDNKITVIEEGGFNQLNALATLDISGNPIKMLQAGSLSGSLQVLRLSNIAVVSPATEVSFPLSSTEHLITLDLSGSPGLARQLLVDVAALAASRELQELDLSFTDLEYIRSDLLHFLPQLRTLHIQGNRINCTQLQWLAVWMRRQDQQEYRKIACESPPELWGTLLIDLQDEDITNHPTTPQINFMTQNDQKPQSTTFEPNETTYAATSPSANVNEAHKSLRNEVDRGTTEIIHNLFIASEEETFNGTALEKHNNKSNESLPEVQSVTSDVDVNSNSSHEHSGEMSMFSDRQDKGVVHPGVLVLAVGVLGAVGAVIVLAIRFTRRRKILVNHSRENMEDTLPGVTELW